MAGRADRSGPAGRTPGGISYGALRASRALAGHNYLNVIPPWRGNGVMADGKGSSDERPQPSGAVSPAPTPPASASPAPTPPASAPPAPTPPASASPAPTPPASASPAPTPP